MITAEELAKEIESAGHWSLPYQLAEQLLPFIQSRADGLSYDAVYATAIKVCADQPMAHEIARRLATPQPPKDAGAVPMPAPKPSNYPFYDAYEMREYGDAREAAAFAASDAQAQTDGVLIKALTERNQELEREAAGRAQVVVGEGLSYGIIDPDYARIFTIARAIAWSEGYAIAMHGSFTRDLDLIAIPWADRVCDPEHLVNRIVDAAGLRNKSHSNPGIKPHGRLAWTLHLPAFGDPRWVDLSVVQNARPSPVAEAEALLCEVCQELVCVGCDPCTGSDAPMEDLHGRIADYFARRLKDAAHD